MQKKSFVLHLDSLDILDDLTDEQAGKLFKAMYNFQKEKEIKLDPQLKLLFLQFRNQFLRDNEKYSETCKRNKENALKNSHS